MATSIAVDHDATEVANGTVARFHGSSESGTTVKSWSPGRSRNQPQAKPASRMGERLESSFARQARATPVPRTTAPGRTFIIRTSGPIVARCPTRATACDNTTTRGSRDTRSKVPEPPDHGA